MIKNKLFSKKSTQIDFLKSAPSAFSSLLSLNIKSEKNPNSVPFESSFLDHIHMDEKTSVSLDVLKMAWLKQLGDSDTGGNVISFTLPSELSNESNFDSNNLLAVRILEYQEFSKFSGSSRSFCVEVCDQSISGCKLNMKKISNETFIFSPDQKSFNVTFKVFTKSKPQKSDKLMDALKYSKSKAKNAFEHFRFGHSHRRVSNSNSKMNYFGNESAATFSDFKTYEDEHINPSSSSSLMLDSKLELIGSAAFHHVMSQNDYKYYQLSIVHPSNPTLVTAQLILGIGTFIPNSPELWKGKSIYSNYLTLLIHQAPPKIPTWRRFWVQIHGSALALYDFQLKESKPAVLMIDLKNMSRIKKADPERIIQKYSFHLVADNGLRHAFFADSEESVQQWIEKIDETIKKCKLVV